MAKKSAKNRARGRGPVKKKAAAGARRTGKAAKAGRRSPAKAGRRRTAKTGGARAAARNARNAQKRNARKKTGSAKKQVRGGSKRAPARAAGRKRVGRKAAARKSSPRTAAGGTRKRAAATRSAARPAGSAPTRPGTTRGGAGRTTPTSRGSGRTTGGGPRRETPRAGGSGLESTLAQTPETGRSTDGPTNPMPTKRSTGTPAGAGTIRRPSLDRARRTLREVEEGVPTPPSSLDLDREASAVRSGRLHLQQVRDEHNEVSPEITGGDVDADWEDAYSTGDEAPGGDNPTPDQDRVDDIGKALGVEYQDNEELKASDKIAERDRHRWELDPASSEDYTDRD